jgi:hypothetical protein
LNQLFNQHTPPLTGGLFYFIAQIHMKEIQQNQEMAMREAFRAKAHEVVSNPDRFRKSDGVMRVGLEMEAALVRGDGSPVTQEERDRAIAPVPFADCELGAAQLEWRTEPIVINAPGGFIQMATQAIERDRIMQEQAKAQGLGILRAGSNPFIEIPKIVRTDKPKYRAVPDFHNAKRTRTDTVIGRVDQVDIGDASVVSLLNSLQCNMEAPSLEGAVELLNRSLMIGPEVVALSANARLLAFQDTGLADLRMSAWETSHDTRSQVERDQEEALRVGLPNRYVADIADYFAQIEKRPFILFDTDHALQIGIGLNWQDTRIKIIGDSAVVEFRPVSIQPSAVEDVAVMLFYLGRLAWSKNHAEPLMDMEEVKARRLAAMTDGIAAFAHELPQRLEQARAGLMESGMSSQGDCAFFCST